jgi:hypothetical protein
MFEGKPKGLIFHNDGIAFSLDDAEFNTEIKGGIKAAGANRVTPLIGGIVDFNPTGGDVQTSQEGFGPDIPIGLNAKRVDYTINTGGLCLLKQLKKLNGKAIRVFLVDNNNVAYGTVSTFDGVEKFRGFLCVVWAAKRDNTGSQNGAIILSIFFDANYENEENNLAAIALMETYEGLAGVVLKKTGTAKAKFVIACSGDDLTTTYGDDLGVPDLYVNSAGANPTSVVYAAATGDLTFTPSGKYKIADAETLDANGIEGLEGEDEYTDLA